MIIRKHKYSRHVCVHSLDDFRRLYKSFLDHRLAALIRIFFRDYASSFTSAYFSSLSYSWKRAEFFLFFSCHFSLLLCLLPNRPCAIPPSIIIFILLSASCYFISQAL